MVEYRIRRSVAIGTSAGLPAAIATIAILAGVVGGPSMLPYAIVMPIGMVVSFIITYSRVRRRKLVVQDDGIEVQRDSYLLRIPWMSITAVHKRRHQLFLLVEELVVQDAQIIPVDSKGRRGTMPRNLEGHPATRRVMVSLYDKHWRAGPIGDHLRDSGATTSD